jgi:DNA repair exonuclease SbcCD ATPase subunit
MLKLSFVVSIMAAAQNKAGQHFDALFFDEALDGLSSDLKVKAFGLFEELSKEYGTIMVVEHSPDFQNLFERRFHVELQGDNSVIEEQ